MSHDVSTRFHQAAWSQIRRASSELDHTHIKGMIEAILFAAPAPMSLRELTRATRSDRARVGDLLEELQADYDGRGFTLELTHGGYTFLTSPAYGPHVRDVTGKKPIRMTRQQLETLAIIAYRQPVTRPEIDDVRGVDSGPVLRILLERDLIRVLGKKEEPGRPLLYGTTDFFLELLGLASLADLPTLREFTELSDESRDTYRRHLGELAPFGAIEFDDEPDAPIDPTLPFDDDAEEGARGGQPDSIDGLDDDGAAGEDDDEDDEDLDEEDDEEEQGD